jgi:branched-subunit amino acid transport protein
MKGNVLIYIACMAGITYLIRVLPLTLIRKEIRNRTVRSFLYYVPYVTLAIMTFPAIVHATEIPLAGILALIGGVLIAWFGGSLFVVAVSCCGIVFVTECVMKLL